MSKDKSYNILLRSQRWITTQQNLKRARNYTCEQCNTKINTGRNLVVHHKTPLETATTIEDMERLCFDPDNMIVLCSRCHAIAHDKLGSRGKEGHQRTVQARIERFFNTDIDEDLLITL